jgi:maltooligosyltrehalose trehalohydrolase
MDLFLPHRRLGAFPATEGGCRFRVWAPHAARVEVRLGSPEGVCRELTPAAGGYHVGRVAEAEAGCRYRYRLHRAGGGAAAALDRPDPASRWQPDGVHGPSRVVPTAFDWQATDWTGIPLSRYVIYELHVGTFTPEGTFAAAAQRLDALARLGVTAVELMPLAQFPGARNWGYDGVYPFAVQDSYGGPEALKRLVDACHRRGLAVILDVVYNHLGPEGNYLRDFGPYFTDFYRTPWGEAVNFDGPESDAVRRFFIENALQWVVEFRVDALRIDAVHAIYDFSARPFLQELAEAVGRAAAALDRRIHCIAECDRNDPRLVGARRCGGLGLDAQWNDDFHHALHVLLTGEREGYYQDYRGLEDFARAWSEGFVQAGRYSAFRRRRHGASSRHVPAARLVVCAQNHDQVGNRMQGDRLAASLSFAQLKLAAAAVLLSPFIPLLFMGEEYGETAPFPYFVSHSDPALIDAVREGRRREFAAFRWAGVPPDPESLETFCSARLRPPQSEEPQARLLRAFYAELIRLRTSVPALRRLSKRFLCAEALGNGRTLWVHRWAGQDAVVVLLHFDGEAGAPQVPLPPGRWRKVLDSAARRWGGPGSEAPATVQVEPGGAARIMLAAHSALLLRRAADNREPMPGDLP